MALGALGLGVLFGVSCLPTARRAGLPAREKPGAAQHSAALERERPPLPQAKRAQLDAKARHAASGAERVGSGR
jgi:hypothetical protein